MLVDKQLSAVISLTIGVSEGLVFSLVLFILCAKPFFWFSRWLQSSTENTKLDIFASPQIGHFTHQTLQTWKLEVKSWKVPNKMLQRRRYIHEEKKSVKLPDSMDRSIRICSTCFIYFFSQEFGFYCDMWHCFQHLQSCIFWATQYQQQPSVSFHSNCTLLFMPLFYPNMTIVILKISKISQNIITR